MSVFADISQGIRSRPGIRPGSSSLLGMSFEASGGKNQGGPPGPSYLPLLQGLVHDAYLGRGLCKEKIKVDLLGAQANCPISYVAPLCVIISQSKPTWIQVEGLGEDLSSMAPQEK